MAVLPAAAEPGVVKETGVDPALLDMKVDTETVPLNVTTQAFHKPTVLKLTDPVAMSPLVRVLV
jgi:hypothetical protein